MMTARVPQIAVGSLIAGRYRVIALLGRGGMAQVVKAREERRESDGYAPDQTPNDTPSNPYVALKLQAHDATKDGLDRGFVHELLAAARARHGNLVEVFDFGIDRLHGVAFFAMELLRGVDLATRLDKVPVMDARWFLPLFCDALDGLECAHQTGIVHKDLKPANLFFDRQPGGNAKLRVTDFGIAHHAQRSHLNAVTQASPVIKSSFIACTPQYCPPEYIESGDVSPASDVYQMGLVLAEALLGWPMVDPSLPATTAVCVHISGQLALPRGWNGSPLGAVVERALARNPTERFTSAHAFRAALLGLNLEIAAISAQMHAALRKAETAMRL